MAGRSSKTRNAKSKKEDQISIRTTQDNAESEVFSDSGRFFMIFFSEKVILYGEVAAIAGSRCCKVPSGEPRTDRNVVLRAVHIRWEGRRGG